MLSDSSHELFARAQSTLEQGYDAGLDTARYLAEQAIKAPKSLPGIIDKAHYLGGAILNKLEYAVWCMKEDK